ncbi:MAG: transcriptional repressor LexA [Deltaproteobacteria bacterium]|nr:transcriptional repressor LexA [Deltaproteobacteria bacterium]
MESSQSLTPRQQQVLDFIRRSVDERGYPPTLREIGSHFRIRSTNGVSDHIRALVRKGALDHRVGRSRTLVPTQRGASGRVRAKTPVGDTDETASIPVAAHKVVPLSSATTGEHLTADVASVPILGRVAAGQPILAVENREGELFIDNALLGTSKQVIALRVAGDSMIDEGIFDGDLVFVKRQQTADRGEIVVVSIEGEVTLKRFIPDGDVVRLEPANSRMKPILIRRRDFRDASIIGVIVGLYRRV